MIPVVKVTQEETAFALLPELEVSRRYLQRHFGYGPDAANVTSNAVHNFDTKGKRVCKINCGMSSMIQSSDDASRAFPIYCEMIRTFASDTISNKES